MWLVYQQVLPKTEGMFLESLDNLLWTTGRKTVLRAQSSSRQINFMFTLY